MSDQMRVDVDNVAEVVANLLAFGDVAQPFVDAACLETAHAVQTEALARLRRQLGPNATGLTAEGLEVKVGPGGHGYIVVSDRAHVAISVHTNKNGRIHTQAVTQSNVPIWIEKGTKRGDPHSHTEPARPYFYVSADLEKGAHFRRLEEALDKAREHSGLGE